MAMTKSIQLSNIKKEKMVQWKHSGLYYLIFDDERTGFSFKILS